MPAPPIPTLIYVAPQAYAWPNADAYGINSVSSVTQTLQYSVTPLSPATVNGENVPLDPTLYSWVWSTSNSSVATVNSSSGLVTGQGSGICSIIASVTINAQVYSGSAQFGCALISPASASISFGQSQGFTSTSPQTIWFCGTPNVGQLPGGNPVGTSATFVSGGATQHPSSPVVVPIYGLINGLVGGPNSAVMAVANLTVNP
jgi:hypothetical protein